MQVLIAGGTGTIGRRLVDHLIRHGHTVAVLSRRPFRPATIPAKVKFYQWDGKTAQGWGQVLEEIDAVVNLAGAGLGDKRWSDERKKLILESRIDAGRALVEAFEAATNKPKVLVQASAVGYYGPSDEDVALTESAGPGDDFMAKVCQEWEASTQPVKGMGVRRVVIRTGVVLDSQGGALPKMVTPFRLMVGGPIGSGRQWMSWIHYEDVVAAIRFIIENDAINGPVNLTAPNPLRNRHLAKAIGKALHRPHFMPTPSIALKVIFGEMATVLLDGQQVLPGSLTGSGFRFKFPTAVEALQDLYGA